MNDLTEKILKIADESADLIDGVRKESYEQGRADIQSELMTEVAMLNETKMTVGDLKCFAYRIKAIAEQLKEQE